MSFSTNLFRLYDNIEVFPLDGRKRTIQLKRTLLSIISGGEEKFCGEFFTLRSTKKSYDFAVRRVFLEGKEAYELTSNCDFPFLHNGNISYRSILRRGDVIDIGFYRFHFLENFSESKGEIQQQYLRAWPQDAFISIEGETGTGKTTLAKKLHNQFCGEQFSFVAINLSAFNEGLKKYLLKYSWPGNYRELNSHLQRKLLQSHRSGLLELGKEEESLDLNEQSFNGVNEDNILTLAQVKENHCRHIYLRSKGSYEVASQQLGISKSTLRRVLAA